MRAVELPALDERRCTSCGDCVAVCPVDCLEMQGATPWLARPLDCTGCGICVLICPVLALTMAPAEPA